MLKTDTNCCRREHQMVGSRSSGEDKNGHGSVFIGTLVTHQTFYQIMAHGFGQKCWCNTSETQQPTSSTPMDLSSISISLWRTPWWSSWLMTASHCLPWILFGKNTAPKESQPLQSWYTPTRFGLLDGGSWLASCHHFVVLEKTRAFTLVPISQHSLPQSYPGNIGPFMPLMLQCPGILSQDHWRLYLVSVAWSNDQIPFSLIL